MSGLASDTRIVEWLGTVSAVTLSNAYHPANERGACSVARRAGSWVNQDMGFDVLGEFWPEISRKFKLPFRGEREIETPESVPVKNSSRTGRELNHRSDAL